MFLISIRANEDPLLDFQELVKGSELPIAHRNTTVMSTTTVSKNPVAGQQTKFKVRMEVKLEHPLAKLPFRARETDAGYDIFAVPPPNGGEIVLAPGRATIVYTGIKIAAPPGYYYTIEGRSSLWSKGIVPNRGIIDSTYCGEVVVSLVNFTDQPFPIAVGQRIAQIILHRQYDAAFVEVEEFGPEYNQRGEQGFGSTGK